MSLARKARLGLLAVGIAGILGSCGLNIQYKGKIDDLQREMPPALTAAYELERELNNSVPVRAALDQNSEVMSHYRALKMRYDGIMTQTDVSRQKEDYDRTLAQYRGLEALGSVAMPFTLLFLALGIASVALYDTEAIAERIVHFTGRTTE